MLEAVPGDGVGVIFVDAGGQRGELVLDRAVAEPALVEHSLQLVVVLRQRRHSAAGGARGLRGRGANSRARTGTEGARFRVLQAADAVDQ